MAPRVPQDSSDLPFPNEDLPHVSDNTDFAISFEEVDKLVESPAVHDVTKLTGNNGVAEDLPAPPCAVMVQRQEKTAPLHSPGDIDMKYGRKRKCSAGAATRRICPKQSKVYEMFPLSDENVELRVKNAINAKRNRDRRKKELVSLAQELQAVTAQRDGLQKRVQQLMQAEAQLRLWLAS